MAFFDVAKVLVKAFFSDKPMEEYFDEKMREAEKEMQKGKLLSQFPPKSTGQGVLRDDSTLSYSALDPMNNDVLIDLKLVNKETNLFEEVVAELAMPKVQFPDLNIPPYNAKDIRPVQELVSRFAPRYRQDLDFMNSSSFTRAVVQTFNGKTLIFVVEGLSGKNENDNRLCVSCAEIDETVQKRFAEFVSQLNTIKESFTEKKSKDELLLRLGAKVTGLMLCEYGPSYQYIPGYGMKIPCYDVKVEGVSIYSVVLNSLSSPEPAAEKIKGPHEFTVESIDEPSLRAVVSSAEIDKTIASSSHNSTSPCFNHGPCNLLLIDGNNVILHDKGTGWRVLKTLCDWLETKSIPFRIYFDATVDHLEMDADGKAYIKSIIDDENVGRKCPAREEADKFILFTADKKGAHILSNDGFRDREVQYPWVNAKTRPDARRVHKFQVDAGHLVVPDLDIYVPIV